MSKTLCDLCDREVAYIVAPSPQHLQMYCDWCAKNHRTSPLLFAVFPECDLCGEEDDLLIGLGGSWLCSPCLEAEGRSPTKGPCEYTIILGDRTPTCHQARRYSGSAPYGQVGHHPGGHVAMCTTCWDRRSDGKARVANDMQARYSRR